MSEFWESAFASRQAMWGHEPTPLTAFALDLFVRAGAKRVLIPGFGYGRNAKPFLDRGMEVTGIEISETAIALARSQLGLQLTIHHGSVTQMPFDDQRYDAIFCHGLIYLLDAAARAKFIRDCENQLAPGGLIVFTVIAKSAPMYGLGPKLGDDWFERLPGLPMFFYGAESIAREFGPHGLVSITDLDEPSHGAATLPFHAVVCRKP